MRISLVVRGLVVALALASSVGGVGRVAGQSPPVDASIVSAGAEPRTIGLALSGGSAKGIAHVGVIRILERIGVPIDVVAGTSMGSVVGGLYASGLPIDSIEAIIRSADWPTLFGDGVARERRFLDQRRLDERAILSFPVQGTSVALPSGAIVGSNVIRLLEYVTWDAATERDFGALPRPFVAVATDLETGRAVPLRGGVLAEALRASSGIPGVVEPIEVDGRLLVDGALSRNLPATDVRDLGADLVICSDVSDPLDSAEELESLIDVVTQVTALTMLQATIEQRQACDVLIRPNVNGISPLAFEEIGEWIARGETAATAHREQLTRLLPSAGDAGGDTGARRSGAGRGGAMGPDRGAGPDGGDMSSEAGVSDSIRIVRVDVAGATDARAARLVRDDLAVEPGDYVDRDEMFARLGDLDATGLFRLVRYRLDREGDGAVLAITVEERPRDRLGVGLRYDDEQRAALLFTASMHNLLGYGSVTRFDLRVGQETRIGGGFIRRRGVTGLIGFGASAYWNQSRLRVPPAQGAFVGIEIARATLSLDLAAGRSTAFALELVAERTTYANDGGTVRLTSANGVLDHETLDRIDFPRSGADVRARFELGRTDGAGSEPFTVTSFDGTVYVPLHSRLVADVAAAVGYAEGAGVPAHRLFLLGGAHPSAVFPERHPVFQGLPGQAQFGRTLQVARIGLRWEVRGNGFLRAGVDVGGVRDAWQLPIERPMTGWALSVGTGTLVGPVELEVGKVWAGPEPRVSVSVGRQF